MSSMPIQNQTAEEEDASRVIPRRARIDPPHEARADNHVHAPESQCAPATSEIAPAEEAMLEVMEEPTEAMVAAVAGEMLETRREQLQLEVSQLAGHLRERLRDLDRRESRLNARVAQLEGELRSSRLWFREREKEFQDRENQLRQRIEELEEQAAKPAISDDKTEALAEQARLAELSEREQQLALREN